MGSSVNVVEHGGPAGASASSTTAYALINVNVNVGVPSSGTIATNGTVTLTTALNTTYSNGVWLWFPAGAVSGGSAGLYWTVMSSTTVGQVYTNYVDPAATVFTPYVPTSIIAATGSNAAYTQTTASALRIINIVIKAGTLKSNSRLTVYPTIAQRNSAATKAFVYALNGATIASVSNTTVVSDLRPIVVTNVGALNRQVTSSFIGFATSGTALPLYTTIDTSVDTALTITVNMSAATEFAIFNLLYAELA